MHIMGLHLIKIFGHNAREQGLGGVDHITGVIFACVVAGEEDVSPL
jgi:hypothetical protein